MPLFSRRRFLLASGCLALAGCGQDEASVADPKFSAVSAAGESHVYSFGVHPLHNPERLFKAYQPLVDYLNARLDGPTLRLEASRDYPAYDEKLFSRQFHFALPNPYQTVRAIDLGYRAIAKLDNDIDFRGIILVRKDSGIRQISDLKGKKISYPAPSALAATMMPQWYLFEHGLDPIRDASSLYAGSQESSMLNVFQGNTAAGCTFPPAWRAFSRERPDLAAALDVKWQTSTLPSIGFVVRDDVPGVLAMKVRNLLITLHEQPEGQAVIAAMGQARFVEANDKSYEPVREFVTRFEAAIRKAESKS